MWWGKYLGEEEKGRREGHAVLHPKQAASPSEKAAGRPCFRREGSTKPIWRGLQGGFRSKLMEDAKSESATIERKVHGRGRRLRLRGMRAHAGKKFCLLMGGKWGQRIQLVLVPRCSLAELWVVQCVPSLSKPALPCPREKQPPDPSPLSVPSAGSSCSI